MQGLPSSTANGIVAFTFATFLAVAALWPGAGLPAGDPLEGPAGGGAGIGSSGAGVTDPTDSATAGAGTRPVLGSAQEIKDACGSGAQDCFTDHLKALLEWDGAMAAFDALDELTRIDTTAYTQSHAIAHVLGRHAFATYPTIQETLANCSEKVFQGCYHGALQAHFDRLPSVHPDDLRGLCPTDTRFREYMCVHGIGHGLMLNTNYGLNASLALCSTLPSDFSQSSCWGGVFMENLVGYLDSRSGHSHDHSGHATPPTFMVDPDDPQYPCNVIEDRYRSSCWLMQTDFVLYFNRGDFQDAARVCDEVGPHMATCYVSLGRDAASYTGRNVAQAMAHCAHSSEAGRPHCVRGFVAESILNYVSPEAGIEVCRKVSDQDKPACYGETGIQGRNMRDAQAMSAVCDTAEPAFVNDCRTGASLPARSGTASGTTTGTTSTTSAAATGSA